MSALRERIENDFTYHPPSKADIHYHERLRESGKSLALAIEKFCPESRERMLALAKVEEAVMWANAAIARNKE